MVLSGGPENPQITPETGLLVRRHDAAQRGPHLHELHALSHFEGPLQASSSSIKPSTPGAVSTKNVRAKAARIKLSICADQRAEVGERATRQDVNAP